MQREHDATTQGETAVGADREDIDECDFEACVVMDLDLGDLHDHFRGPRRFSIRYLPLQMESHDADPPWTRTRGRTLRMKERRTRESAFIALPRASVSGFKVRTNLGTRNSGHRTRS